MEKEKIKLDDISYATVIGILHHCYVYPMDNIENITGYTNHDFGNLYKYFDSRSGNYIRKIDLPIIISGFAVLLSELSDNDFYNLIDVSKEEALNLLQLLKNVELSPDSLESNIVSGDWGYSEI